MNPNNFRFSNTVMVMTPTHLAGLPWAGSVVWLEHPADNREGASSNLASPTPFSSSGALERHLAAAGKSFKR